jgi:alkylation response protein AidB-like acyl-CoA dehydrogenase
MTGLLTEEQEALVDLTRTWLRRSDPVAQLRPRLDQDGAVVDRSALAAAGANGLLGLLRPAEGGSLLDLALIVEEGGRALSSLPLAEIGLGVALLDALGDRLADDAAAGEALWLPVASPVEGPSWSLHAEGDALHVRGVSAPVPGLSSADGVLLLLPEGVAVLPLTDPGVRVADRRLLDLSRPWGSLELDVAVPLRHVDRGLLSRTHGALAVLRAADALGAAARLLEMTVQYAGEREQFGRPIGGFQAVKHMCADMALLVEASREVLHAAAHELARTGVQDHRLATAAVAYAAPAASRVASLALQVHGGMGFTWEHDLHLLLRRAKADELVDGTPRHYRRALVPV